MPFRSWIIAIAFGLIATLGVAQNGSDQPEPQPQTTQDEAAKQPAQGPGTAPKTIATEADEASEEGNQNTSANGDEDSEQWPDIIKGDGWAQWAMAATGLLALFLSAWAVWLVNRTLKETRVATDAARSGADAAAEANRILLLEMRPWVDFNASGKMLKVLDGHSTHVEVTVVIQNIGKSPAANVLAVAIPVRSSLEDIKSVLPQTQQWTKVGPLLPGQSRTIALYGYRRLPHDDQPTIPFPVEAQVIVMYHSNGEHGSRRMMTRKFYTITVDLRIAFGPGERYDERNAITLRDMESDTEVE